MSSNDLQEFQPFIDAYPAPLATKLNKAVNAALASSIKYDNYWIINKADRSKISDLFRPILKKIKYPEKGNGIPLIKDISQDFIPVLNILSKIDGLYLNSLALPRYAETRQRWLGLRPAEATEREISVGDFKQIPLWYAVQLCQINRTMAISELLTALNPNLDDRLTLFASTLFEEYGISANFCFGDYSWGSLSDITADQAQWAVKWADKLVLFDKWLESEALLWPIFAALVKAKASLKPEWEIMIPLRDRYDEKFDILEKLLISIPRDRRHQAITQLVSKSLSKVSNGLTLLPCFPSAELTQFILDNIDTCSFRSPKEIIEWITDVAEDSAVVKETLDNYLATQKESAIKLTITETLIPNTYDDLNDIHRLQLETAGIRYGAEEFPLYERIPFFASDKDMATSEDDLDFAQQLKIVTLCSNKEVLYDAFLYLVDNGTIFKAGTTDVVASISQGSINCKDKSLLTELKNALGRI